MRRARPSRRRSTAQDIVADWVKERPDLTPSHYLLQIYMLRIARVLDRLDDRISRKHHGVSSSEMRVLFALRRIGPPFAQRPTDLFRALLVTSGAITKQVSRLESAGLVQRLPDERKLGGILVQLTDKGVETADKAIEFVANQSILSPRYSKLTEEQRTSLQKLCEKVLTDMESVLGDDDLA